MSDWTMCLIRTMVIIACGSGFQHGYHTGVTNIPQETLQTWMKKILSERDGKPPNEHTIMLKWCVTVSVFAMGGILGGSLTAVLADKFGRRNSLISNSVLELLGVIFFIVSKEIQSLNMLIVGRFVVGVNAGLNGGLCQIYLTEIAPNSIRGIVAGFYQLVIVVGILMSQVMGVALRNNDSWSIIFVLPLFPAALQAICLHYCPESPMYLLILKGDEKGTEKALARLRGTEEVRTELEDLMAIDNLIKEERRTSVKRICTTPALRMKLVVCSTIMVGQQLCGINVIIYYSADTLTRTGFGIHGASYITVALTSVIVLATIVGLCLVEKVGRRKLLFFGFLGMAATTTALLLALVLGEHDDLCRYMHIFCVCLIFIFFAPGVGTVPWFYTAEIFYPTLNTLAVSISVPINWFANVIVAQTFLPLVTVVGYYVYLAFMVLDMFFLIFVYIYLPETTGKTIAEIMEFHR